MYVVEMRLTRSYGWVSVRYDGPLTKEEAGRRLKELDSPPRMRRTRFVVMREAPELWHDVEEGK